MEQYPVVNIGLAAGYAAGLAAAEAHRRFNTTPLIGFNPGAKSTAENPLKTRLKKVVAFAVGPLALTGALAGGVIGAIESQPANVSQAVQAQAPIELVVDHSGKTAQIIGDGSITTINQLTKDFDNKHEFISQVFIAGHSDGAVAPVTIAEALKDSAGGEEGFDTILQTALTQNQTSATREAGVVLITDDDVLVDQGEPQATEAMAKADKVPIYVINVAGGQDAGAKQLRQLAKTTGGQYFSGTSTSNVQSIYSSLEPQSHGSKPNSLAGNYGQNALIDVAVGLGVIGIAEGLRRRYIPGSLAKLNNRR